jgi:hypothetical protein
MRATLLLLFSVLSSGCWDRVEVRAAAGGPLSKPAVFVTLSLHREWSIIWGEWKTYRLDVEVDQQKYRTEDVSEATAVSISPDRKTFAVRDRASKTWQIYALGTDEYSPGMLTLVQEGEPLDELKWPANSLEPVPDYSWLQWVAVAGVASGIGFAVWRSRKRKLTSGA